MDEIDSLLRDLADDPTEYERQGGLVMFRRQGRDCELMISQRPGVGPVLSGAIGDQPVEEMPAARFVQEGVLQLHRLSAQIVRTIDRIQKDRPAPYVDGPSELEEGGRTSKWPTTAAQLKTFLAEQELGTTRVLQVMAGAGQGKTFLLETLSRDSASGYVPDAYPQPILLTVDLLGRYVGTIDDAIAGALNNTYRFPGLSQRDIALAIRKRWLNLALDGFDELVARVGARDAFLRVTELLEQLDSAGTLILSARTSFFELYQITAAIRSYLQPKRGSYSTAILRLNPWGEREGRAVFSGIGSGDPDGDLAALLEAFGADHEVVLQPFFITRLARAWLTGERFASAGANPDPHFRSAYIIRELIEREATTKWTDLAREKPLLTAQEHAVLLEGVAEETWRTGAFKLSAEELRIAGQMALSSLNLPPTVLKEVEERTPTHAAFVARDSVYSFLHDRFLHYYLGLRIGTLLKVEDDDALRALLSARELPPEVCEWAAWKVRGGEHGPGQEAISRLEAAAQGAAMPEVAQENAGRIAADLLDGGAVAVSIAGVSFHGDVLRAKVLTSVRFADCRWWQVDLRDAVFQDCQFADCSFDQVVLGPNTRFDGSLFRDCRIRGLDLEEKREVFAPAEIQVILEGRGAEVKVPRVEPPPPSRSIAPEVVEGLSRLVKLSVRSCDFARQDVEGFLPKAAVVLREGEQRGVLREWKRATSGPHKDFLRFAVDRQLFLRGQAERTGDKRIDEFWDEIERRFPGKSSSSTD